MAVTAWLVDTSALVRISRSPDAPMWTERTQRGLVRISSATLLEVGWSARTGGELRQERGRSPLSLMPVEYLTPAVEDRAREVQALLADRSQHRGPSPVDLLVCAAAELSGLVVLHVDRDIEVVGQVTGQVIERLILDDPTLDRVTG